MNADGNFHHRHAHRHDETLPKTHAPTDLSIPPVTDLATKKHDHEFGRHFATALTIAGIGLSLLMTVFSPFHVDVFLRVYRLPLQTYSIGNVIITLITTANDLIGAYFLDMAATKMNRSDLVGISGSILALCFL